MSKAKWSILPILFCSFFLAAQTNQAAMSAHPKQVKQGEQVLIAVKLSPVPNVPGRVDVFVAPEGSDMRNINGGNGVGPGQSDVGEIGITIPINGKPGQWKVIGVRFQPPNSSPQELTISGSATFEVMKRESVVPTNADVQVK